MLDRDSNRGCGRFEGTPSVQFLRGGSRVRILDDFVYVDPDGRRWVAPRNLVSDGASIPRLAWDSIGPPIGGPYFFAALQHDARYRLGDCTKEEADLILWDAALCGGTSQTIALIIAQAVAIGGGDAWFENERKRAACGDDLARLLGWA